MKARVSFESLATESTSATFLHLGMALCENRVNPEAATMTEIAGQQRLWTVLLTDESCAQRLARKLSQLPHLQKVRVMPGECDLPSAPTLLPPV